MKELFSKGKKLVLSQQSSVLSAATIIMVMVVVSKVLGFVRQRVLFTFFTPEQTDLFLAAFEIPDVLFEVLVFGTMSAAFIPVFSKYIAKDKTEEAWHMVASSLNIILAAFLLVGLFVFIFAEGAYNLLAGDFFKSSLGISGGFSYDDIKVIATLSRVLLFAQVFFIVSSFMTGVLESFKRFLFPAIAPLAYNLGIIMGTILWSEELGILAPTIGALLGAMGHLLVQAPAAYYLGFRFSFVWDIKNKGVIRLFKLATPRILELSIFQVKRFVWLFLGSLTAGGFTYLKSADLLQSLPVGVFGISLAKAALPTLSRQYSRNDIDNFKKTMFTTLGQILFLVIPISVFMIVLRVPVVRLIFGAQQFDWRATLQTSYALSAFAIGTFAYGSSLLISRAFYALHDTKTPVAISIATVVLNAILGFLFVIGLGTDTWGIALAYSIAGIIQFMALITLIIKKLNASYKSFINPLVKMLVAASVSGLIMRVILRTFDRSVWVKQLSFLSSIDSAKIIPFERFALDTRYTGNLLVLTIMVSIIGVLTYLILLILMRSQEVWAFFNFAKRILSRQISPIPAKKSEQVAPTPTDSSDN